MGVDRCYRSAADHARSVRAGEVSPVDLVDAYLERLASRGDVTNAFVTVLDDAARDRAREAEEAVDAGENLGPLHGVPVAIKDLSETKAGVPNTKGLQPLTDNVADRTSVTVERLEEAGAIVLGTTNTPELGYTPQTDNELQGPTGTPFDPRFNAGGSSGGSAAALADGLCALATGSDVGGSLRVPASCCHVVSVKPTFGVVPKETRPNAFESHTPFGVLGPMARTVEDVALMLSVLSGRDDRDPFSVPTEADYLDAARPKTGETDPWSDLRVGYSPDLSLLPVAPEVRDVVGEAVDTLADAGVSVTDVTLDLPDHGELSAAFGTTAAIYFCIIAQQLEETHGLDLTGDDAESVSDAFVTTLRTGEGHDALAYRGTDAVRTRLYDTVESALAGYDALVCPVTVTPPLTHDEPFPTEVDGERVSGLPMDWYLAWPFNMTGHPVVTVPAGLVDGLPVGLQIVTDRFDEETGIRVAAAFERTNPWAGDYPRETR